ncbi:EAL domain-containing protein [Thiomicrorhabdus sp. 6S3-12]|uniref:EAL domain-containing response regulator n=1 Tax=Thiomicrorhabdus sp. 6S3-12 TaxID=2819681 RepID=UPI001AAC9343|nr:EAL domain-containing protein [Thiomicrorhabdus sp. 6S3-12]MBO1924698.1 EAL domain-containing protein [Thiomicrorhabdus sp. 6S3-12]
MSEASLATILIVEDDQVTRMTLSKVLSRSGYRIIETKNGREGLSAYMEHHPDLVLMDVMMPRLDGFAATRAIREYEQERAIPILMLTSLDDIESIDGAFDAGATDFITKPINWGIFVQRVKYALRTATIEAKLRNQQAQLNFAQKLAKLGYWEWDALQDRVTGSDSAFALFDVPAKGKITLEQFLGHVKPQDKSLINQALSDLTLGHSAIQVSFRIISHDGSIRHVEFLGQGEFSADGHLIRINGSAQDISRLHRAETQIEYQNNHDSLTGLPNRHHATRTLKCYLDESGQKKCAVILFDIDRFKHLNGHLGQEYGDQLLISLAQRLKRIIREEDYVARLGNDEFCILISNLHSLNELNHLINRLEKNLNSPFVIDTQEVFLSFSTGIASYPDDGQSAEELLNNANIARANAKNLGGNQYLFYQNHMNESVKESIQLENDLRNALKNREIEVYYQPQVDAQTLKPCGSEALVRWHHPKMGLISPAVFVPLAETIGLINEIGDYVMRQAIMQTCEWYQQGYPLRVGINLSSRQFTHNDLMRTMQSILSETKLPSHLIDLEITESLAMNDANHTKHQLNGLKAMGVSISIDDFGTGYSSLAYLQSFPIDTIKIDRSFVMNLDSNAGRAIAKAIIAMGHALDLEVIAEGIENDEQVTQLRSKGCHIFQGFKFGKPMPADDFFKWLQSHH